METETETRMVRPSFVVDIDDDRSQDPHEPPGSNSFKKEEPDPITLRTISLATPVSYFPSNRTESDKSPMRSFYTSTNDTGSASSPSSLPSSASKPMAVVTRHLSSFTNPDLTTPVLSTVPPAPAPLLSSAAPTLGSPHCPAKPTAPYFPVVEADGPFKVTSGTQGGKGSPGKKSPKSVSRLCFPFVTTSPKWKDKDRKSVIGAGNTANATASIIAPALSPTLPVNPPQLESAPRRHKYSCSPTQFYPYPFSVKRDLPAPKHHRHSYPNRGYSREALDHVKRFWSVVREDVKSTSGSKPYTEKEPQVVRTGTAHHRGVGEHSSATAAACTTAKATDPLEEKTVPASIHPRRGDISALRDPQCTEIDRTLSALDSWTIAKMVWMVEMDLGMAKWEREREEEERKRRSRLRMRMLWDEERDEDGEPSSDLLTRSTSMSSLSDDSEVTLVEVESLSSASSFSSFLKEDNVGDDEEEEADDMLQLVIRGRRLASQTQTRCSGWPTTSTSPTPLISPGRELDLDKSDVSRSVLRAIYQTRVEPSKSTPCQWSTDWMNRWEIVKNISRAQKLGRGDGSIGFSNLLTLNSISNTNSK